MMSERVLILIIVVGVIALTLMAALK